MCCPNGFSLMLSSMKKNPCQAGMKMTGVGVLWRRSRRILNKESIKALSLALSNVPID